ncbi:MAG: DUF1501 domain-containing protein [Acidobacteria bacterium]|nr:DUF1501 domain-containing protein [Acidobacteriota bacterium]
MHMTRRVFLKSGALAVASTAALPAFLKRAALGIEAGGSGTRRLIVIFQRGAADGLNIVIPHGEPSYYTMRPTIRVPRGSELDLDGFFGLHPAMSALEPLFRQRHLAVVHAAGSPDKTRSHFDAQDYMESGTPGVKSTGDGWLNRSLQGLAGQTVPLRAVALRPTMPRILSGEEPAVAFNDIQSFAGGGRNSPAGWPGNVFQQMYADSADRLLHASAQEAFEAARMLKLVNPHDYTPAPGADYPRGRFANDLRQLAQLIKSQVGVEIAFAEIGGWDHHVNEGSTEGQLANLSQEFSQSLAAFWTDLGDLGEETVIVTMSEFGRTARENGNRGTDHGHGNVMFVLGGRVRGGKVYGRWPGLAPEQLNEGRDLVLTTDFRQVLAEALHRQLGIGDLASVFPGFHTASSQFLGLLPG